MEHNKICDRAKILLIDEDDSIFYLLRRMTQRENYKVYTANTSKLGMEMSASLCPDLIVMEFQYSDADGIEMIRWFREWTDCPIVILSQQNNHTCKAQALYAGADDYIEKPFFEEEVAARIYTALRRRIKCGQGTCYQAGDLKIDFNRRQVTLLGEEIHFSPVEYRIMECLALNAGAVVTYQMLLEKIWGPYASSGSRILRVNMTNIRKKIEKIPMDPEYIITIPRVGYRMKENQGVKTCL